MPSDPVACAVAVYLVLFVLAPAYVLALFAGGALGGLLGIVIKERKDRCQKGQTRIHRYGASTTTSR